MNNKNVKVVDEHNIDRNANVIFAFDLEGSEYVTYWIERDETQNNIFVSKVIKNLDSTFNLLDIDDSMEKEKISDIVKSLIMTAVNSENDKLVGDSVTLSDGKVIKLIMVSFNKEQRVNVKKSYVTTVKKEVTKVAGVYYDVVLSIETPKVVEEIFPSVMPVVPEEKESPVLEAIEQPVVEAPVLSMPEVSVSNETPSDSFVAFGSESTVPTPEVAPQVVSSSPVVEPIQEPVKEVVSEITPVVAPVTPQPEVVESITTSQPVVEKAADSVPPVIPTPVEPVQVLPSVEPPVQQVASVAAPQVVESPAEPVVTPVPPVAEVSAPSSDASQPLMFTMDKETNLKKALGEVANSQTIPVENIQSVREFGVDEPVQPVASAPQQEVASVTAAQPAVSPVPTTTTVAGFANSKFFMVVAVAFFLASCIFLGYEVFHYFQLTK